LIEINKWDERWLEMAKAVSSYSKDPSTKVGCVIANGKEDISFGYNGFPCTCEDKEEYYLNRDIKYKLVIHAEVNAIAKATRNFKSVEGATVYTYPLGVCPACANLLSAFGVSRVISLIDMNKSSTQKYQDLSETEFILSKNGMEWLWLR
jgi:dCMP deaminase